MGSLEQVFADLALQIRQCRYTNSQSILRFQAQVKANIELLSWLKAQTDYPQFYLCFRDQSRTVATIGKVRSFTDLKSAQQFMQQSEYPLIGGMQFYGKSHFVLPEIFIEQQQGILSVSLFIESERLQSFDINASWQKMILLHPLPTTDLQKKPRANQALWHEWVNQALNHIENGTLSKLVLANETCFDTYTHINPQDFLAQSEKKNTGCYHFLWAENPHCHFVGSTPERLFARTHQYLHTEALAGTALMSQDKTYNKQQADWLLNDEKNRIENQLVAEDILQNIQPLIEQVHIGEVEIKPLRKVQHLLRKIQATLRQPYQDSALLQAIHPTAAVCGLPQQQAKKLLPTIETFDRSWYAGTLGIMSLNQAEFCVTIRSAFIELNRVRIFAGAGIVKGSIPSDEWLEIERKASGLISLLEQNENGEEKECQ
ncbi:isochorismate synthase MenF [Rodentibacter caecimuris]|uniref:Isochorismate synthase MenF n=1 Tax=Rodentibacter caecimuris TaxID=1796644 RepID=A0ABX3KXF3_9PAST|nr:isochorismate synthase [Rodentibacter heylii]